MKKLLFVTTAILVFTAVAAAQVRFEYSLNYYSNRNNSAGADAAVRLINPGTAGTPTSANEGKICADIYVFDSTQEMIECCSCPITANGLREFSVLNDLTQNPLTGFPAPNTGVIKVISDRGANCNELAPAPFPELLGWATHVQQPVLGTFVTTEDEFQPAPLVGDGAPAGAADVNVPADPGTELQFLGQACAFVQYLGSGKGVCSCGTGL